MADDQIHLAERIADRLRGIGGLAAPDVPLGGPGEDERARIAAARRAAVEAADAAAAAPRSGESRPRDFTGEEVRRDTVADGTAEPAPAPRMRPGAETPPTAGEGGGRDIIDLTRRGPPVTTGVDGSLSFPQHIPDIEPSRDSPPVDMAALEKAGLVVGHKVRTRISEEFRISVGALLRGMQTNYAPGRGAPNVIMITSARPGEGKSFSSLNLAGSIAQHAQRDVLLVDIDAKQRSLSFELGLSERQGILDLSANPRLRIEDVVLRTALPHLSVIPIGSGHTVGSEITPARPLTTLVERIARRTPNAVVLLDAPPCLSTSDPSTLAPFVGQIVMMVEAERTQRSEVAAALDLIKACPSVTLMLNKVKLTTSYTFGAYHYFGTYS